MFRTLSAGALLLTLAAALTAQATPVAQSTATSDRPNVLLCIADDWSFGHAGAYGCNFVDTPAFDRIAKEGLLFERAYTPNAKCAPSRACLLTGRNSWQLGAAANHVCAFPPEYLGYVEALGRHGYTTGFTGKGWGPGTAHHADGTRRQLTGPVFAKRKVQPPASGIGKNDYAANFRDFLESAGTDQPWCFWYGAIEPHRGYERGSGQRLGKTLGSIGRVPDYWPDNAIVRGDMLDYAVEVEWFDQHLGRMLAELEQRGQLENTIVIVTSDHGMPFPRCKGQAYDASNHVPLAIRWPNHIQQPGRVVTDYVSLIDIAPTVLEAAGLEPSGSGMRAIAGHSLGDLLANRPSRPRDHVLIGKERHDVGRPKDAGYPIRGIISDDRIYLRNFRPSRWPAGNPETGYPNCDAGPTKSYLLQARRDGQAEHWALNFGPRPAEELFDLRQDTDCVHNLAYAHEHQPLRRRLADRLSTALEEQEDPRMFGRGEVFDAIPYVAKRHRGFYERLLAGEKVRAGWTARTDIEPEPVAFDDYLPSTPAKALHGLTEEQWIARAVASLVHRQGADGAWPYEGTWRIAGKIPGGFRVGSTGVVVAALLASSERERDFVRAAIDRGIERILTELGEQAMAPYLGEAMHPVVWGHIYGLDALCRVRATWPKHPQRARIDQRITELVQHLAAQEIDSGGWNYGPKKRQATFVTAAALQALLWAEAQGADLPEGLIERGRSALLASRLEHGGFRYAHSLSRPNQRKPAMNGAIARSPLCELTLWLLGDDEARARLPALRDAFHRHHDELIERRGHAKHHVPPHNIAPYYVYFGHAGLAQAARLLPETERANEHAYLIDFVRRTATAGATVNDRVFEPCASACTAFAIITLLGDRYPLPPRRQ